MTHDELVRFAAEKVGIAATKNDGWAGGWLRKEGGQTDWTRIFGTEEAALAYNLDLTSPELFLKGLGVLDEEGIGWLLTSCEWEMWKPSDDRPLEAKKHIPIIDMHLIPLYFWQCYAELEGGQE